MIASLITALYLLGLVSAQKAYVFLYLCGAMLIICEVAFTVMGILAFNGVLALYVGYVIQTQQNTIFGLPVDWSLLFGLAFIEAALLIACFFIVLRTHKMKVSTGTEAMIGHKAEIVEWHGTKGAVRIQGENWKAWSEKELKLSRGDEVSIASVDGLKVKISV